MFVQKYKSTGNIYIRVVESYRTSGSDKPKLRIIKNYGNLEKLLKINPNALNEIEEEVRKINEKKLESKVNSNNKELSKLLDKCNDDSDSGVDLNYGIDIYTHIWKELKLDVFFKKYLSKSKIKYDIEDIARIHVIDRILNQNSNVRKHIDNEKYSLHNFYRSLSKLSSLKDNIELHLHNEVSKISDRNFSVCFYDVTTYYFESQKSNELLNFGYSKDNKLNQVQVVMGLLIDSNGIPITYELFSGNTNEFSTLEPILLKLKEKYGLKNVIITADRGLNSKSNLARIRNLGFNYVMAYKIRSSSKELEKVIFNNKDYRKLNNNIYAKEHLITQEVKLNDKKYSFNDKLLITYSAKRAQKDRADRERLVDKAIKLSEKTSYVKSELKKGGKKYLNINISNGDVELNEQRITEDSKYDGYYAIVSSEHGLNDQEIIDIYTGLWKIEESFRVLKTNLKARPTFVYSENSVRGHFLVCFIALIIQRLLEYKLRLKNIDYSTKIIQDSIKSASLSIFKIEGTEYILFKKTTEEFKTIIDALGYKELKGIQKLDRRKKLYLQKK